MSTSQNLSLYIRNRRARNQITNANYPSTQGRRQTTHSVFIVTVQTSLKLAATRDSTEHFQLLNNSTLSYDKALPL